MAQPVQGPDGKLYQFPDGTTKEQAVAFFQKKGISGTPAQAEAAPAEIRAVPPSSGLAEDFERWSTQVAHDLRRGTDQTLPGRVLKFMGAPGLEKGVSQGAADFMGSPLTGPVRMAKGTAELTQPGKRWEGTKDVIGGALETATIPGSFVAPEASEATAAMAGKGIAKGVQAVGEMVPSMERAGKAFQQVKAAAGDVPLNTGGSGNTALAIKDLADAGGSMPKVVRDFIRRTTDPNKQPITYAEARDFYSNASRLSADEAQRLTPIMKRQVSQFRFELNKALEEAAGQVGQKELYQKAMGEYAKAARWKGTFEKIADFAKDEGVKAAIRAVGLGAATYGGYKLATDR